MNLTRLPRLAGAAVIALSALTMSCSVDALLEADVPVPVVLSITVAEKLLTTQPGGTVTVSASVTRLSAYTGDITFSLNNVPSTVTAEIGSATTVGAVTTVTVTFRVSATATSGSSYITIRGRGGDDGSAVGEVEIRVVELPAITLAPNKQSFTIIRGGIAPFTVNVARTNATAPVTLSLIGPAGVSGISAEPVSVAGSTGSLTIAVATGVAPGTYTVTLRGSSSDAPNRDVPLIVVVSPDALQIIPNDAATAQAQVVTASVIVNRNGITAPVVFSVDGLPTGVSATLPGGATGTTAANPTISFSVGPTVPPGAYTLTVRARAGGTETTALLYLTIGASNVALTLVPQNVNVLQGTASASVLTLIRTSFTGAVSVQLIGVPTGITIEAADSTITGTNTTLIVTSSRTIAPGYYPVTVRIVPAPSTIDGPALEPVTASLGVTVIEAPISEGNVLLDWSRCATPEWVASQDGIGPWLRIAGTDGRFRFGVSSPRAGFAYVDGGTQVIVRYGTAAELSAAPIDLCPAAAITGTKTVTGNAYHNNGNEQFTWRFGGGSAVSTLASPTFTITGAQDGPHDLFGWGQVILPGVPPSQRMYISRDMNPAPGQSLGDVSLTTDSRAFVPAAVTINIQGLLNEARSFTASYLTRAACEVTELYRFTTPSAASGTASHGVLGVPGGAQRPDDYHLIEVAALNGNTQRAVSLSYRLMTAHNLPLPVQVFPAVSGLTGSYRRFRVVIQPSVPESYNGTLTLRYSGGSRTISVSASTATFAAGTAILEMPDLSDVSGFPMSAAVPLTAAGSYFVETTGSTNQALCSEGASRWSSSRTGSFSGAGAR